MMGEIEKTDVKINFVCNHCKVNGMITKKQILPFLDFAYDDDFLIFKGRCPRCRHIFEIEGGIKIIPRNVQKELLDNYAGIVGATYNVWQQEERYNDILEQLQEARRRLEEANKKQQQEERKPNYVKRLYPHWNPNTEVIKDLG